MNENVWEIITEALGVFWDENRSAARCFEIFGENRKWNEAYFTCVAFSETLVQDLPKRSSKSLEKSSTEETSQFAQEMIRVQKRMFFSSFFFQVRTGVLNCLEYKRWNWSATTSTESEFSLSMIIKSC